MICGQNKFYDSIQDFCTFLKNFRVERECKVTFSLYFNWRWIPSRLLLLCMIPDTINDFTFWNPSHSTAGCYTPSFVSVCDSPRIPSPLFLFTLHTFLFHPPPEWTYTPSVVLQEVIHLIIWYHLSVLPYNKSLIVRCFLVPPWNLCMTAHFFSPRPFRCVVY